MKKRTVKQKVNSKISRYERRAKDRHRRQEEEYGRDEFLFGAEDDEYDDEEYYEDEEYSDEEYYEDEEYSDGEYSDEDDSMDTTSDEIAAAEDDFDEDDPDFFTRDIDTASVNKAASTKTTARKEKDVFEELASGDDDDDDYDFYGEALALVEGYGKKRGNRDFDDSESEDDYYTDSDNEDDDYYGDSDDEDDDYYGDSDDEDDDYYGDSDYEDDDYYGDSDDEDDDYAAADEYEPRRKGNRFADSKSQRKKKKPRNKRKSEGGFFAGIVGFFTNMSMTDRLIASTGICVLIIAIVTGSIYVSNKNLQAQVDSFADIGSDLNGVSVIGENGLVASVEARATYLSVQEETPVWEMTEEPQEEVVEPEDNTIQIVMKASSIQSDLKIKFSSKSTDKLITGIAFAVTVTSDSGKTYDWVDENKDGLIYHTDVPNGTYKVVMKPLEGAEYENYKMPSDVTGITVTDTIAYKKVDVADEVKKESEVNAAAEDTGVQDAAVESTLSDTVEWVESSKTLISGSEDGYTSINKNDIVSPNETGQITADIVTMNTYSQDLPYMAGTVTYRINHGIVAMAAANETPGGDEGKKDNGEGDNNKSEDPKPETPTPETPTPENPTPETPKEISVSVSGGGSVEVGKTTTVSATVTGTDNKSVTWTSSNDSVATVGSGDGVVTGKSAGTVTITAKTVDGGKEASCTVTVTEPAKQEPAKTISVSLDKSSISLKVGSTDNINATVKDYSSNSGVTWKSSNDSVATVSGGKVTAKAKGTATITATSQEDGSKSASCAVTVTDADKPEIKVSAGANTLQVGKTTTVTATVTGASDTTVTWSSSDSAVATVDNGTVKAVKVGKTTITATLKADTGIKASVDITVTADDNALLKDKKGNQVYVKKADGGYREATSADYNKSDLQFFIKGNGGDAVYSYTGWQTIDGNTYFFNKDGKYVTGDQVIQGAKYSFDSNGHLSTGSGTMGIDVSKWNGSIDWNAVKNSGVSYVIIRCGYRGSSTGALIEDPKFRANISGAKAAGLAVGAYFFTQATNEVEAVEEASMAVSLCSAYGLNLPLFLDVEGSGGRGDKIDAGTRTAVCKAFCQTVQNSGFTSGIYANKTWLGSKINTSALTSYKIWLAQYAANKTYSATRVDYWQYTSKGKVSGISGNVDLNIRY